MSKRNGSAGVSPSGKAIERAQLTRVSVGIASAVAASAAGFGAQAQEPAPAAEVPLPPLEVTTQQAKPKAKVKAKQKAATSSPAVSPTPQAPSEPAPASLPTPSEQLGLTPASGNTNQSGTGLGRLPGTLQDTPQIVNVVPQKIIQEQKITTIDQALRTVPGVTVAIGEGGGGLNGDQFRIRGFQAKGDLYIDGLRDFGVYVRDAFAYEQVQVFKGPSSESFGQGTGGGVINLQQKTAHLGDATSIEATYGMGPYARGVADINQQITSTIAARAVIMYHDQDIVDRDHVYSDRRGFLGSLAFGLGTDETFTLNYLHQHGERMPEYGVPMLPKSGTFPASKSNPGTPITEFLVPRSNFYGKELDHDETNADIITARYKNKLSEQLTVFSDSRLAFYDRDFASGPAECSATVPSGAGNNCQAHYSAGDYDGAVINYGGGNPGYVQDTWGAQNITGVLAKFDTGGLRHELVAGIDAYYQENHRDTWFVGPTTSSKQPAVVGPNSATLTNPVFENVTGYYLYHDHSLNNSLRDADATSFAVFASDRVWLTKEISVLGGVRWDDYEANYRYWCVSGDVATTPYDETCSGWKSFTSNTEFWSPKLSVIWEPSEEETYYVSWAKSFVPPGTFVSNEVNAIGTVPGQDGLQPEVSETWEAGAKYTLFGGRLGLTGAAFHIIKDNATYTDPQGDAIPSGEVQRVQGFELGVSGQLSKAWFLQASYAYLDSKILSGSTLRACTGVVIAPANQVACGGALGTYVPPVYDPSTTIGNKVQQAPENAFNLWTTYNLSSIVETGPGKLEVGGGVTYVDGYWTNSANSNWIPHQLTFDGLVSYEIDSWKFAVNGYNLTDQLYYVEAFNNRATPAPGRTVLFTAGKKF